MNVITLASRKGGAGKSTLTAHLAAYAQSHGHRCLVIDADPQGSLTLWQSLRADAALPLSTAERGIDRALALRDGRGLRLGVHRHRADHVGGGAGGDPRRDPGADPGAARLLRSRRRARDGEDRARAQQALRGGDQRRAGRSATTRRRRWSRSRAPISSAQGVPVLAGQISQRAGFQSTLAAGASAGEVGPDSLAAAEIAALWTRGRAERRGDQRPLCQRGRDREPDARAGGLVLLIPLDRSPRASAA